MTKSDYMELVCKTVEQGGGHWDMLSGWYDKHGLKAISVNTYSFTDYDWILDDYILTVTFGYTPDEIAACPRYDLSRLPVDWEHVVEYRVETRGDHKEVAHEFVK